MSAATAAGKAVHINGVRRGYGCEPSAWTSCAPCGFGCQVVSRRHQFPSSRHHYHYRRQLPLPSPRLFPTLVLIHFCLFPHPPRSRESPTVTPAHRHYRFTCLPTASIFSRATFSIEHACLRLYIRELVPYGPVPAPASALCLRQHRVCPPRAWERACTCIREIVSSGPVHLYPWEPCACLHSHLCAFVL